MKRRKQKVFNPMERKAMLVAAEKLEARGPRSVDVAELARALAIDLGHCQRLGERLVRGLVCVV